MFCDLDRRVQSTYFEKVEFSHSLHVPARELCCIISFPPLVECLPLLHLDQGVTSTTLAGCLKGVSGSRGEIRFPYWLCF